MAGIGDMGGITQDKFDELPHPQQKMVLAGSASRGLQDQGSQQVGDTLSTSNPIFEEGDRESGNIKGWLSGARLGDTCMYMGHEFVAYEHESNEYKKSRFLLLSRNPQLNDVMGPFHYNHRPTLDSWIHNIDQYTRILGLRSMQHTRIDANLLKQDSTNITFIAPSELTTTEVLPSWDTTSQEWIRGPELYSNTHHALTQEKIYSTICFLNLGE